MTIEIIDKELVEDDGEEFWAITIEIEDGIDTYLLAVGEPGATAEGDLQPKLEARKDQLWATAQQKGIVPDVVFTGTRQDRVIKALALVILDEINILRALESIAPRTVEQLRGAIKAKLKLF